MYHIRQALLEGKRGCTVAVFPYVGREGEKDHVELLERLVLYILSFPTCFMTSSFLQLSRLLLPGLSFITFGVRISGRWLLFFLAQIQVYIVTFTRVPLPGILIVPPLLLSKRFRLPLTHLWWWWGGVLLALGNFFEGERVGIEESPDYRILLG